VKSSILPLDDEMDFETEGETVSEEPNNEMLESETNVVHIDGWKEATMDGPKQTQLLKMQGHNLTFCQMLSPSIILVYLSMMSS
jgi:hypothetical protein